MALNAGNRQAGFANPAWTYNCDQPLIRVLKQIIQEFNLLFPADEGCQVFR